MNNTWLWLLSLYTLVRTIYTSYPFSLVSGRMVVSAINMVTKKMCMSFLNFKLVSVLSFSQNRLKNFVCTVCLEKQSTFDPVISCFPFQSLLLFTRKHFCSCGYRNICCFPLLHFLNIACKLLVAQTENPTVVQPNNRLLLLSIFLNLFLTYYCFFFYSPITMTIVPWNRRSDLPSQVPPLTPGTNLKMTQALAASFSTFDKDRELLHIPKGE